MKLSSFPHPEREVLVPPSTLGGTSVAAHAEYVLAAERSRMIDYSDSLLSLRLLNHHYAILSQRFFFCWRIARNPSKNGNGRGFWTRFLRTFLTPGPVSGNSEEQVKQRFHPVAPQSSCLPSFSQVAFCKFHCFLGPKTPNWISCFKYTFLPLFITSETFCSAEWLQLWGEIVSASVWQKTEVQLYQYKTQKNRWECLDLQRNCHPSKQISYFYLVLASLVLDNTDLF